MPGRYKYKWWALVGVCLLSFTAFLDFTIVNTALPFIQVALNADILQLQWIANIFPIILSMTMIATGKLADLFEPKYVFYTGVLLFAVAALGAGFSSTVWMLVLFRGLQALGAAVIFIVSATLISDVFPEKDRIHAISIYGGVTGFGLMIGPFLGGILIGLLSWKWVFWINIPLIAIGLSLCSFSLKGTSYEKHAVKIDWAGLFLLVFGLGALMYGIIEGAQTGWTSIVGWTFLVLGLASLCGLILLDKKSKNPLLDLTIFRKKLIVLAAFSCSIAGIVSSVFMFFDPLYLRVVRDQSPYAIGLLIAAIPAAQAGMSFVFNRSVKLFGLPNLFLISVASAFISVVLHQFFGENTPVLLLIFPFFLLGINWGLSNSAMITAVNEVISPQKIGEAIGTLATIWNIIGALFLAVSTAIFHASEVSFLSGFHHMVYFNMSVVAIIFVLSIWTKMRIKARS